MLSMGPDRPRAGGHQETTLLKVLQQESINRETVNRDRAVMGSNVIIKSRR